MSQRTFSDAWPLFVPYYLSIEQLLLTIKLQSWHLSGVVISCFSESVFWPFNQRLPVRTRESLCHLILKSTIWQSILSVLTCRVYLIFDNTNVGPLASLSNISKTGSAHHFLAVVCRYQRDIQCADFALIPGSGQDAQHTVCSSVPLWFDRTCKWNSSSLSGYRISQTGFCLKSYFSIWILISRLWAHFLSGCQTTPFSFFTACSSISFPPELCF